MQTETINGIQFTKIKGDINGNPRWVCHYLCFIKDTDFNIGTKDMTTDEVIGYVYGMSRTAYGYKVACRRANELGGRKYNNKQYGGGIVFQSYNIHDLADRIKAEVSKY